MNFSYLLQTKSTLRYLNVYRSYYSVKKKLIKDENYLPRQIYQKIKVKGPITIADYMKEVLTNPTVGYYMQKDMFGETGDFITSPEVSQMFGEMIAVWLLNEWQKMGSPKPLQLIELGPGRGTLASDILKVFNHFKVLQKTSLQLVEVSPTLSEIQAKKLCNQSTLIGEKVPVYRTGITKEGIPINWYKQLSDVPRCFSLLIAHEFFDALPIHKFHKTYSGYKEVLIDIDPSYELNNENLEPKFRYVLSRHETPIQKKLISPHEKRDHVEISPDSMIIQRDICERLKYSGGLALICDYGHYGSGTDTFRAFKKHKQVDPLIQPGSADLTADVDFSSIRQVADEVKGILTLGPVNQRDFLLKTGLELRFKALKENLTSSRELYNLNKCYSILIDADKMGERFKFMALFPETMKKILDRFPVVGFS
ncbi:protein arginine methyltransferase NDUFAF7, mitochondrial isoform X1 [Diorhabda carinulata]|uniref:protein arginine methyltransferase NDUFAF7, mitochondrial isoform X1 n=2 Tax=Diorhabda carinulata TaxID=1163345 RepID=UPI0025A2FF5B|nr:protein arginine methyltransferase NDUFAF7, mitochondrial isoform X1 [Diorhabda carinulata]